MFSVFRLILCLYLHAMDLPLSTYDHDKASLPAEIEIRIDFLEFSKTFIPVDWPSGFT